MTHLFVELVVVGPRDKWFYPDPVVVAECDDICKTSGGKLVVGFDAAEAVRDVDVVYTDSWMR